MKRRFFLICFSAALLLMALGLFSWGEAQYAAPTPEPSVRGGFYEAPFTLTFDVPKNGNIYYTTDGSTPTGDSKLYVDGIEITDRSGEPNVYNAVQNVVQDWKDYTPDPAPVEKGTVIRAVFINDLGIESPVLTQTYFVGIQPPERGYTLSLVFEHGDLFGENGLHVTGTEYDTWYLSGADSGPMPVSNFECHTEIETISEWMDVSGDVLVQPIGLRIQGASARYRAKKRFILVAREEYSGSPYFETELFDSTVTHSVMLKDALPDAILYDLVSDRTAATQQSVPVRVYLNGEYWYDSYALERYDEQFFRQHYQVDDRILAKDAILDEESAAASESDCYAEFMYWVRTTDFTQNEEWEKFHQKADVQSYIDFLVTNYYFCNVDFDDSHNYVQWRSPEEGSSHYEDMRWRWCNFDVDVIDLLKYSEHYSGNAASTNTFTSDHSSDINRTSHFRALKPNPEFRRQFVLSFMDMVNNNFAPANVEKVLEKHGQTLDWMDGFFRERPKYAAQHLAEEFDLTGTLETVTVSCENPEMGTVTVNTSVIDLEGGAWSGQYFTDYPITVTARPKDGYEFIGWKGGTDERASSVTLSVDGGLALEAVFAKSK